MKKTGDRIISVRCSVTGREVYVNPTAIAHRLEKYGSIEAIERDWISRQGKQVLQSKAQKQEEQKEWGNLVDLSNQAQEISRTEYNLEIMLAAISRKHVLCS